MAHPLTPRDEATVPQAPTSPRKGEVAAEGGGRGLSRMLTPTLSPSPTLPRKRGREKAAAPPA